MNYKLFLLIIFLMVIVANLCADDADSVQYIDENSLKSFSRIARSSTMKLPRNQAWRTKVPEVVEITIKSSYDGTEQPALFYNSNSAHLKPVLVALHSWSEDYQQPFSIPYGIWAVQNDWVFIHPDYRGKFNNPEATASEAAIQDIVDALNFAKRQPNVDTSRIYLIGFSGGAMTTLIMVGRYPEFWTAAVAWVPVFDLAEWFSTTRYARHNYSKQIESSCGGPPLPGTKAGQECARRSASSYLARAKGSAVKVYIATGIKDRFVPPGHALEAFNELADSSDRFSHQEIAYINKHLSLPGYFSLAGQPDLLYADAGLPLIFERSSNNVLLKIFRGGHDVIYNAGLLWLSRQKKLYRSNQ